MYQAYVVSSIRKSGPDFVKSPESIEGAVPIWINFTDAQWFCSKVNRELGSEYFAVFTVLIDIRGPVTSEEEGQARRLTNELAYATTYMEEHPNG